MLSSWTKTRKLTNVKERHANAIHLATPTTAQLTLGEMLASMLTGVFWRYWQHLIIIIIMHFICNAVFIQKNLRVPT